MTHDASGARLDQGDLFPDLEIRVLGNETIRLPHDVAGRWCVLLFTRGHW